jgi:hypothetical protein
MPTFFQTPEWPSKAIDIIFFGNDTVGSPVKALTDEGLTGH